MCHLWEEPWKALSCGNCTQWRSRRQDSPGGLKGEAARGDLRSCAAAALWRRRHRQRGSRRALQQTPRIVSGISTCPAPDWHNRQGFARVNRNAADCFPAPQSAPCSSRSYPLSAREAREGERERTKDLRRRDDLVSLGVILGRPLELSWPLHANHHMSNIPIYFIESLDTITAWLPMLACTGTSY